MRKRLWGRKIPATVLGLCFLVAVLAQAREATVMQLRTEAFRDQGRIPVRYCMPGAGGENVSLPLGWSDVPEGTKSFALSIIDHHKVANNWVHWLVVDIPPEVRSLPEGASGSDMPEGARELRNSFGEPGYGGPRPPAGTGKHPYVVTVYALDKHSLDLSQDTGLEEFQRAVEGHVLGRTKITGLYEQK